VLITGAVILIIIFRTPAILGIRIGTKSAYLTP